MSGQVLVFPGMPAETKLAKRRELAEQQGIPFIDVETPLTVAEQVKIIQRTLGIPDEMDVNVTAADCAAARADPHDIGEVAERLADAFNNGDLPAIKREFERRSPLYAAALSLAVLTRIRPGERTDFHAMMHRMARS